MPKLPPTAMEISDLVEMWPRLMPELRDQGEADRMNLLLGSILTDLAKRGREVPDMVYVADAPPEGERAFLLAGDPEGVKTVWFAAAYARWARTPLFKKFWESLSAEDKVQFFKQVPNH